MKPSVLIIADFPNWAYHEIQQFIKNNISDDFNVYCDYLVFNTKKKSKNPLKHIQLFRERKRYQFVKKDKNYDIVLYLGFYFDELLNIKWKANKIIKGIYTENFPPKNAKNVRTISDFAQKYLQKTDAIVCGSQKAKEIYHKIPNIKTFYASAIKDDLFFKRKKNKRINNSELFIVGWTGNPNRDFKGFYSHVVPAVKLAQETYPNIKLKTRFTGPYETLPFFYCDVDIIIIASDADVGPSLFSEASLMEVPSISTNIGLPSRVIKNYRNGFIVEKDIEQLSKKIIELYENREIVFNMSKQIRIDYLKIFDAKRIAQNWKDVFNEVLNS